MATSADEQKMWVQRLSKKVSRKGIGQQQITSSSGGDRSAGYVIVHSSLYSAGLEHNETKLIES